MSHIHVAQGAVKVIAYLFGQVHSIGTAKDQERIA